MKTTNDRLFDQFCAVGYKVGELLRFDYVKIPAVNSAHLPLNH